MTGKKQLIKRSIFYNTSLVTISRIAGMATSIFAGIITAHFLGPSGKGQINIAISTGMMLAQILCLGFDRATPYNIASKKITQQYVLGAWIFTFILGVSLTFGLFYPIAVSFLMENVFSGVSTTLLFLGFLSCPLYLLRLLINSILLGTESFLFMTWHDLTMYILSVIATLTIVFAGFDKNEYVGAQVLLGFLSVVIGFIILYKTVGMSVRFDFGKWIKMFRYGSKSMLSQLLSIVDLRLDIYLVNYFTSTSCVGVYSVAGGLASLFWILPNAIASVLFPKAASLNKKKSSELTALLCRNTVWQTIIFGAIFLLLSKWIIGVVYGEKFSDASLALTLLMPGVVGQVLQRICLTDCAARGYPGKATFCTVISAVTTIVLDIILIPKYGINGAAVASSFAAGSCRLGRGSIPILLCGLVRDECGL